MCIQWSDIHLQMWVIAYKRTLSQHDHPHKEVWTKAVDRLSHTWRVQKCSIASEAS